jgi:hypothetical protein
MNFLEKILLQIELKKLSSMNANQLVNLIVPLLMAATATMIKSWGIDPATWQSDLTEWATAVITAVLLILNHMRHSTANASANSGASAGQSKLLVLALLLPIAFAGTVRAQSTNSFWGDVAKVGEDGYADLILPLQLDTNDIVSFSAGAGVNTANNRPVVALTATVPVSTYASVGFVGAYGNNSWYEGGVNLTLGITNSLPLLGQVQEFAGDGAVYDFRTSAVANYSFTGVSKSWQVSPSVVLGVGAIIANTSDQPGVDVIGGGNLTWLF